MNCPTCGAPGRYQREFGGGCPCCGADNGPECPACGGDTYLFTTPESVFHESVCTIECPSCGWED